MNGNRFAQVRERSYTSCPHLRRSEVKKIILLSVAALAFVGCKGRSNNPFTAAKAAAADKDLQGTFDGPCSTEGLAFIVTGAATGLNAAVASQRVQYKIEGDNLTRKTTYFKNADCSSESFIMEEIGSVENVKKGGSADTGYNVDMVFRELKETPLSDEGVTIANSLKWCGNESWAKDKAVTIDAQRAAEKTCYGVAVPRRVYNMYRVDAGKLYLATDDLKENRPEERPTKVTMDPAQAFTKK
jgi:hypothetical protein